MKKIQYILISLIALFGVVLIVSAAPTSTILRTILPETTNTFDVGTSTLKWRNGTFQNMIVSSLSSSGNPCISVDANGLMATTTCGGITGVSTSTPFSAGYIPLATSSSAITNSNIFQSGLNIGIGTTTPNNLFGVYELIDFNNTDYNTKIGYWAGLNIVAGAIQNTFIGYQAGFSSSTGSTNGADFNTGIGYQSFYSNATGNKNSAMGNGSLFSNTTGSNNLAMGNGSLFYNTTGSNNIGLGNESLFYNTTGSNNLAMGSYSGEYANGGIDNATSTNSIYIGYDTKSLQSGDTNEIVIGDQVTGLGSNTVVLGNSGVITTALYGNIGIGTTTPVYKLDINGDLRVKTSSTLGNVISGIWNGTAINDSYISSASNWNSKATSTLTLFADSGLTGGGDLTADRIFTVGAGTNIVVSADAVAVTSTPTFTNITTTGVASSTNLWTTNATTTLLNGYTPSRLADKILPWSGSFTSSTLVFSDNFLGTLNATSTIDGVQVVSRDSSNSIGWNLLYGTDPTAATSTWFRVFTNDQTTTSTPTTATKLTSFASSTPGNGQFLVLYIYNASTTYTNWTVNFHSQ